MSVFGSYLCNIKRRKMENIKFKKGKKYLVNFRGRWYKATYVLTSKYYVKFILDCDGLEYAATRAFVNETVKNIK